MTKKFLSILMILTVITASTISVYAAPSFIDQANPISVTGTLGVHHPTYIITPDPKEDIAVYDIITDFGVKYTLSGNVNTVKYMDNETITVYGYLDKDTMNITVTKVEKN